MGHDPAQYGARDGPTMGERIAESRRRHAEALEMGGAQAVGKHRASGRLPVRERIALVTDEDSWFETGMLAQPERRTGKKVPGDGVVTGFGRVDGRPVGLIGIDEAYKPAAARFRQFPGLCLTVNEIICSGDRLALRYTEQGASARHHGARAAWGGVGLYRWDGQRLLENYVEQDYFGRRRQLAGDGPDPVEPPAVAPWDTRSVPADPAAEAVVRGWLAAGDLTGVTVDDGHPASRLVAAGRTDIDVLFSAGSLVAFHAVRHGALTGEDPRFSGDGEAMLHLAGVVRVAGGQVAGGRVIRDRLGLLRRTAGDYRGSSPGESTGP